jgi:hypothetical protein
MSAAAARRSPGRRSHRDDRYSLGDFRAKVQLASVPALLSASGD